MVVFVGLVGVPFGVGVGVSVGFGFLVGLSAAVWLL